jgi:hypothetical protein
MISRRVNNEVFIHQVSPENPTTGSIEKAQKIVFQFLGRPDPANIHLNVLHQCVIRIKSSIEKETIIEQLRATFSQGDFMGRRFYLSGDISL